MICTATFARTETTPIQERPPLPDEDAPRGCELDERDHEHQAAPGVRIANQPRCLGDEDRGPRDNRDRVEEVEQADDQHPAPPRAGARPPPSGRVRGCRRSCSAVSSPWLDSRCDAVSDALGEAVARLRRDAVRELADHLAAEEHRNRAPAGGSTAGTAPGDAWRPPDPTGDAWRPPDRPGGLDRVVGAGDLGERADDGVAGDPGGGPGSGRRR